MLVLACLVAVPAGVTLRFLGYFASGPGERVRDPLHPLLRSSGALGLGFGIASLSLFAFMWLYPLRKRVRALAFLGGVPAWLRVHIWAGLTLPWVAAVHAGWRFTGLIGLGYGAMLVVVLSGIVGRYLYVRIPRHQNGVELTRDEIAAERRSLLTHIAAATGFDPVEVERALALSPGRLGRGGVLRTLVRLVTDDLDRRRAMRELERRWTARRPGTPAADPRALAEALRLARRELALEQQLRMVEATRSVFQWWHVAHLPVALTAFLAVLVHVAVAVFFGGVLLRGTP